MAFTKGRFNPTPELGDLVITEGFLNLGIIEVIEPAEQGSWLVVCSDDEERNIVPRWTATDEEEGKVEDNFWWQDVRSSSIPWWE